MTYGTVFRLIAETRLSPERAAEILGVSGMTLRRWKGLPPDEEIPVLYARAFAAGVPQLIIDGHLPAESLTARDIMLEHNLTAMRATMKALGCSGPWAGRQSAGRVDSVVVGLSQIGADPKHVKFVDRHKTALSGFAAKGPDWKERIKGLASVIRSSRLTSLDKVVAYGALFYLLTPLDMIPDNIPFFGFLDDFALLELALAYYRSHFPKFFSKT